MADSTRARAIGRVIPAGHTRVQRDACIRVGDGDVEFRREAEAGDGAMVAREHPGDGEDAAVENHLAANRGGVSGEAPHPQAVAENDGVGFAGGERPAEGDGDAGNGEEVVRHLDGEQSLSALAVTPVGLDLFVFAGEAVEDARIAEEAPGGLRRVAAAAELNRDERLRIAHRGPAEEGLAREAEDGRVGADGEREAGDRGEGECGVAAEAAGGVAEVGGEVFDAAELPGGAGVLAAVRAVAELAAGLGEGGGAGEAAGFELVGAGFEVELKLGVELVVEAAAAEEIRRRWRSSVIMRSS